MKPLVSSLAIALLTLAATGCGSKAVRSGLRTATAASSTTVDLPGVRPSEPQRSLPGRRALNDLDADDYAADRSNDADHDDLKGPVDLDGDADRGAAHGLYDRDDTQVAKFGRPAAPADRKAVVTLVNRYFAAARAADGNQACAFLSAPVARTMPATYGRPPTPYARGNTCPEVMHGVFRFRRYLIAAEALHVRVVEVRVDGDEGATLLSVGSGRMRQLRTMPLVHEGGAWKLRWPFAVELL